jgi:acetyl-CoA carboxylase carboxyltransferase component
MNVPYSQISIVHGISVAGGAYVPAMSDGLFFLPLIKSIIRMLIERQRKQKISS